MSQIMKMIVKKKETKSGETEYVLYMYESQLPKVNVMKILFIVWYVYKKHNNFLRLSRQCLFFSLLSLKFFCCYY